MKRRILFVAGLIALLGGSAALAEKKYGPGVTDTQIKIGQTMPYSGPASLYSTVGKAMAAYFDKINAAGGVNGRKINLISLDERAKGEPTPSTCSSITRTPTQQSFDSKLSLSVQ